jgi:hypothetical protein
MHEILPSCQLCTFAEQQRHSYVAILGAFEKLRKRTISFVMSVCLSVRPSVRVEQLGCHWQEFNEITYLSIFRKSVEKIQFLLKSDKNIGNST